jgi:RNase P subunit RPR2
MEDDCVATYEKYCKCGYKALAILATSELREQQGFRRDVTIICPCCGEKIFFCT